MTSPSIIDPAVPLQEAVLCLNCEMIYSRQERACPRCASEARWYVKKWIPEEVMQ